MKMGLKVRFLILLPFFTALAIADDQSAGPQNLAQISRSEKKKITGLEITQNLAPVQLNREGNRIRPSIQIHGTFLRPGWALKFQENILIGSQRKTQQEFVLGIYLTSRLTEVPLTAINEDGAIEEETLLVAAPEARELEIKSAPTAWSFMTGVSRFNYFQTNPGDLRTVPLFFGARFQRQFSDSSIGVFGEGRINPFTLSSSPDKQNPQYLDTKFLGSVDFRQRKSWQGSMAFTLGLRYSTFIANGGLYGYQNLIVGDVGFLWRFGNAQRKFLTLQIDYFPIGNLFKIDEGGLEGRVQYLPNGNLFGMPTSLEFRYLRLGYIPVEGSVILLSSVSIGLVFALFAPKSGSGN